MLSHTTNRSPARQMMPVLAMAAVPLVALAIWFAVQHPDMLPAPESSCNVIVLIYDEFDLTAMALRGLNAECGRPAGRATPPGEDEPVKARSDLFPTDPAGERPLEPRYFVEYPHAALLLFRAGYWIQPAARDLSVPASVLDCDYHDLALQRPRSAEQQRIWAAIATAARFYTCLIVVCQLLLMAVLWRGYGPGTGLRGGVWLIILPAAMYFTLNRFDVVPALLTAICFACLGRRWRGAAAVALGLAIVVKVYPILFIPLILRYLWPERREAVRWGLICGATGLLAFAPLLAGADLQAVLGPIKYQLTRPPESGWTIYGCFLPEAAADGVFGKLFRLGVLGLTALALLYRPIPDLASLLRRAAALLFVFVSLAVFFSPQWIVWFVPLLAPLVRKDRRLGRTIAGLDLIMYLSFPVLFWILAPALMKALDALDPIVPIVGCAWNALFPSWPAAIDSEQVAWWIRSGIGGFLRGARFFVIAILIWQLMRAEWPGVLNWTVRRLPRFVVRVVQWV